MSGDRTTQLPLVNLADEVIVNRTGTTARIPVKSLATQFTQEASVSPTIASIATLGTAAGRMLYSTAPDTWAEAVITAAGRALLDDADAAAQRATLGLGAVTATGEVVADLDTITASGWSRFAPGAANAPIADNSGYVLTITSGSVGVQMAWGHLGSAADTFAWIRWRGSSGWRPWVRLYGSQSEILGLVGAGQSGTVATTSGSVIDFVSIPSGVNRVTLSMQRVSLSGSSYHKIQLGAGAVQSVGYDTISGLPGYYSNGADAFIIRAGNAAIALTGAITFNHLGGNIWVGSGVMQTNEPGTQIVAGKVALTGTLDRIRLRSANGTDTFDEGSINISWER